MQDRDLKDLKFLNQLIEGLSRDVRLKFLKGMREHQSDNRGFVTLSLTELLLMAYDEALDQCTYLNRALELLVEYQNEHKSDRKGCRAHNQGTRHQSKRSKL